MCGAGTRDPHDERGVGHEPIAHAEDTRPQCAGTVSAVPWLPARDLRPRVGAAPLDEFGDRAGVAVFVCGHPRRSIGIAVIDIGIGPLAALDQRQHRI